MTGAEIQLDSNSTVAFGLKAGQQTFAALFVNVESARAMANRILEITT
jgi:hypothetical protein